MIVREGIAIMDFRPLAHDELAAVFGYEGVAAAYRHRPPYPDEVFAILDGLITDRPRDVLDIGAGEGSLARPLAERVDHLDAVEVSAAMVAEGRRRPGGDRPNLRWIAGSVETAPLDGPYALVTAGASLHWMSLPQTLARLSRVMAAGAYLAIVGHGHHEVPWRAELTELIVRHSRSPGYNPSFSLADALRDDGLFDVAGCAITNPVAFRQPVASYVEHFHSTASLARELMPPAETAAFDRAIVDITAPWAVDGILHMQVAANLTWGRPTKGHTAES
ncbi:MAG TPA: class I SAM-dependent methyltransferase [Streptosporangiaceae bacterium]